MCDSRAYNWDLFIAHAGPDQDIAEELYALMQSEADVFLASMSLKDGDIWAEEIPKAQKAALVTVVLISEHTDKAHYQCDEIASAIELATSKNHHIMPVYLNNEASESKSKPYGLGRIQGRTLLDIEKIGDLKEPLLQKVREVKPDVNEIDVNEIDLKEELFFALADNLLNLRRFSEYSEPLLRQALTQLKKSGDDAHFLGVIGILDSSGSRIRIALACETDDAPLRNNDAPILGRWIRRDKCAMGKVIERTLDITGERTSREDLHTYFKKLEKGVFRLPLDQVPLEVKNSHFTEVLKGTNSVLGLPIFHPVSEQLIGTLNIDSTASSAFPSDDLGLIKKIQEVFSSMLVNLFSESLESSMAAEDKIWSRAYLDEYLNDIFKKEQKKIIDQNNRLALAFVFLNIDKFDMFNQGDSSTSSHKVEDRSKGDSALRQLAHGMARIVQKMERKHSPNVSIQIFHYSGDEFCLLFEVSDACTLPNTERRKLIDSVLDEYIDSLGSALSSENPPLPTDSSAAAGVATVFDSPEKYSNIDPNELASQLISCAAGNMKKAKQMERTGPGIRSERSNLSDLNL